jgi:FG-GAP-like repeat
MLKRIAFLAAALGGISACKGERVASTESVVEDASVFAVANHGGGKGGRGSAERAEVVREESSEHGEVRLYSGAVADLDGDGALELVAGGFAADEDGRRSTLRVYRQASKGGAGAAAKGDEAGGWTPWLENGWEGGKGSTARNLEIGDVDGDGVLDVVVLGRVGPRSKEARARMAIFNVAGGALKKTHEVEWNDAVYTHGYGLALGDLDGDGRLEIATAGFLFDGARERGFVRVWKVAGGAPALRAELLLGDADTDSMRVNDLAIGDVDGEPGQELVVAGRIGGLKKEGAQRSLAARREHGELSILRLAGDQLETRGHYSWLRGSSLRLRSVVLADLEGDGRAEIVVGGQYDADGKAALGWFRFGGGKLTLAGDASSTGATGEIKDLVAVGSGAFAHILATGPLGDRPKQQGNVGAWHMVKGALVSDASMISQHGDETKSRAVVVVPGAQGSTLLTIGHARTQTAMVGQVLRWPMDRAITP